MLILDSMAVEDKITQFSLGICLGIQKSQEKICKKCLIFYERGPRITSSIELIDCFPYEFCPFLVR